MLSDARHDKRLALGRISAAFVLKLQALQDRHMAAIRTADDPQPESSDAFSRLTKNRPHDPHIVRTSSSSFVWR